MFKTSTFRVAATLAGICLCGPAWALGSTPVTVVNPAITPALTSSVVTLVGYMLDCSAAPCAAIAH